MSHLHETFLGLVVRLPLALMGYKLVREEGVETYVDPFPPRPFSGDTRWRHRRVVRTKLVRIR